MGSLTFHCRCQYSIERRGEERKRESQVGGKIWIGESTKRLPGKAQWPPPIEPVVSSPESESERLMATPPVVD